jgi:hypothetical protein
MKKQPHGNIKEMKEEGWKPVTINGVKLLEYDGLLCQNWKWSGMDPMALFAVVEKLGRPDKIHDFDGQICTIEYYNRLVGYEETA